MSRNFEILQSIGNAHEAFRAKPLKRTAHNVTLQIPDARVREEITKLVQRIYLLRPQPSNGGRSVLFAGIDSGEASASICALCGKSLASQVTGTVCIVDANTGPHSIQDALGLEYEEEPFTPSGHASLQDVQCVGNSNLFVATIRPTGEEGAQGNVEEVNRAISDLRAKFDYLILNARPLASCADTLLIGKMADGVVMVIDAHVTRRAVALQIKALLDSAGVPILGSVLNGRTFPIPESVYKML